MSEIINKIIIEKRGRKKDPNKKTLNMAEYKKAHYEANKEYILNYHARNIQCPNCEKTLKYSSKSKHLKDSCINKKINNLIKIT